MKGRAVFCRVVVALCMAALCEASGVARAQDFTGVIPLFPAPGKFYLIPTLSDYIFPDDHQPDVLTQRNSNNRTGASYVAGLNAQTVRRFRHLAEFNVGGAVSAQPLYASSAIVQDKRTSVLIIATSFNDVFAVVPSAASLDQGRLWQVRLGPPAAATDDVKDPSDPTGNTKITPGAGCSVAPAAAWAQGGPPNGTVGIEATPVIDLANGQVIVGYRRGGQQRLAAISLNHGGGPNGFVHDVAVRAPSNDAAWHKIHRNRASLLLADGVVYVAFSGLCEASAFHGSVAAFDAKSLDQVGWFSVPPADVDGGGIWQGTTGIAADDHGDLYLATGNRSTERGHDDESSSTNSILRLRVRKLDAEGRPASRGQPYHVDIKLGDFFTPYRKIWQDAQDMDLASAGVVLLPKTRYLVGGGKEAVLYVLDRANLGGYEKVAPWNAAFVSNLPPPPDIVRMNLLHDDPAHDRVHQKFPVGANVYQNDPVFGRDNQVSLTDWGSWPHIHGTPVFARFRPDAQFLYVWAEKDRLKRFQWHGDKFDPAPLISSARPAPPRPFMDGHHFTGNGMPGGMVSVNIDGESGTGVVFATVQDCREDPQADPTSRADPRSRCADQRFGILRAFDPFKLQEVWNSHGMGASDEFWFAKFVPPTIAEGRVFVPTYSGKVIVYGP